MAGTARQFHHLLNGIKIRRGDLEDDLTPTLYFRLSVAAIAMSVIAVLVPVQGAAQDTASRLQVIPLDRGSPEVKEFQDDAAARSRSRSLAARRSENMPEALFFALIDPQKGGEGARLQFRSAIGGDEEAAVEAALKSSIFDTNNLTWFETQYGPPINAKLFCSWTSDPQLERTLASPEEAEKLERNATGRMAEPNPLPSEAPPISSSVEGDPELEAFNEIKKSFTLGGRPCVLERICSSRSENFCTSRFLDFLISRIRIIQLGR